MSKRAGVRRYGVPFVAAFAILTTLLLAFGSPAKAAACTTTPGTPTALVTAVSTGSAGDVICLNAGITYGVGASLDVNHNLTIETDPAQIASGGKAAVINGGSISAPSAIDPGQFDILDVAAGKSATISKVIFTGVQAAQSSNGAIYVLGTASIDQSLISSNGGNGMEVDTGGQATVTNSTITQSNGASGIVNNGAITLNQDTIANNTLKGIDNLGGGASAVFNTILSGNGTGNCTVAITIANGSGSNSDDSGTTCGTLITTGGNQSTGTGVITGASPTNNGGPTNTYALPAGSVAIDHGTGAGAASIDQRGFIRDATPDVGAFEFNGAAPATLFVIKHVVGPGSPGNFQLTITGGSPNPGTFTGQDTPGTMVTIASATPYSIGETMVGGGAVTNYTASASGNCTGGNPATGTSGAAGTTVTCTITNTAKPFNLLVTKTVDNTGCVSNCGTPADFTMTVTDTTTSQQLGQFPGSVAGTTVQVPAGDAYNVTEQADAAQTGKYTPGSTGPCSGSAAINGSGTCAFTNSFLTCPQPANSGPQPAPGAPGSSSNTCVNANVAATIQVTSPASISFPPLAVGQTSGLVGVPVTVFSNDPTGYQLTVKRTAFFSPTDIPLAISCPAVGAPQAFLAPFTGASAQIPVGSSLNLGTSNTITQVSGDSWPFQFQLGPIPFGIPAGAHQSVVTFTAVGL